MFVKKNLAILFVSAILVTTMTVCGSATPSAPTAEPSRDIAVKSPGQSEIEAANQQESSMQTTESMKPEAFPVGEYHDDMGSQLIISKVDDKNYSVEFGIYKLMYTENAAVGSYDVNTGILSFSGKDISTERTLSADVTIQGDNLIVTLTHSEFPDCPAGTTFEFEPGQP